MHKGLTGEEKNKVLARMAELLEQERTKIITINQGDVQHYKGNDKSMLDRLKVDAKKVDGMIRSVKEVMEKVDPIGRDLYQFEHENSMRVVNRSAPFGTVLIIYESRPDVTIEAAAIAFKSGNRILLKGGKESLQSNLKLVQCWHQALEENGHSKDWIQYLNLQRSDTQAFLKNPSQRIDLIVPRGGEGLIRFVKQHANCPVLVSGRGNNFLYVHTEADLEKAKSIIWNGKMSKISACNALDKVLIDKNLTNCAEFSKILIEQLEKAGVEVLVDASLAGNGQSKIDHEAVWYEEFLDYKIVIGLVDGSEKAVEMINKYAGGHSVSIVTEDTAVATQFMEAIDAAAVYHNASTRFTDGGEFGMGAELAISTEKMHHRGPLGLEQLVTNKWFIYGNGQVR